MKNKHKTLSRRSFWLTGIIALFLAMFVVSDRSPEIALGSYSDYITAEVRTQNLRTLIDEKLDVPNIESSVKGVAIRLQQRLAERGVRSIPLSNLADAIEKRRELLRHQVVVTLHASDGTSFEPWVVSLQDHPYWVEPVITPSTLDFAINENQMKSDLVEFGLPNVPAPVTSTITDIIVDDEGIERVIADQPARDGYRVDVTDVANALMAAFEEKTPSMTIELEHTAGPIVNQTGRDLGPLQYLATGRSNFKGSGNGRINNVKKGHNEKINNILIPPGSTFSFNDSLGKVTMSRGWQEALGIFNASELRPVVGGGICQVATTVYRAALATGLPITERKNHSIYVSYYEMYGVGIDATVFQGKQDFQFLNDTGHHLLLQSYTDGFEAYVHVFGAPDGRRVTLSGPYFSATSPETFNNGKDLRGNEIGWQHDVRYPDGTHRSTAILSRYNSIPRSLATKYAEPTMHTSAPGAQEF